tara:strand:- start:37 stop:549 length:513 start_codon:yes stop_codon:yes gene_type:complete
MSNKKSSDSGSSLKSIGEIISSPIVNNILSKVLSSKNVLEKGPMPNLNISPEEVLDKGPAPKINIDPKDILQLLSDEKKEQKEKFMINNVPTTKEGFDMFTNKFQKLNEKGQTMFRIFTEENPDVNPQTILDILMGKPELLSNQKTLSDLLDERTQSKANGGIVQLFGNM